MVYRRVSNLFDYTLHVLVSWDPKLDRSIPGYPFICLLCIAFISVPCSLHFHLAHCIYHCIISRFYFVSLSFHRSCISVFLCVLSDTGVDLTLIDLTDNCTRHMVYRRVSNLFDYSLHVLVSYS